MTEPEAPAVQARPPTPIPRSCSDVYRLWAAIGLSILLAGVIELILAGLETLGVGTGMTEAERAVRENYGSNLIAWDAFAFTYLVLGVRAFYRCDHAELVRRLVGSPLPAQRWKRWLLAGGGGIAWPILIATWAFVSVGTAFVNREDLPWEVLVLAGLTVVSCVAVIAFSFAVHYAREDVAPRGLEFFGNNEPVFSDYIYFSAGNSVSLGTSDVGVLTSAMRRTVTVHGMMAWVLNTGVLAVLLSLITS